MGRRLGQHFLKRSKILEQIAEAVCPEREPLVVEIGAGRGALTKLLLPRADRVVAIEADPELVACLLDRFPDAPNLTVVHGDVLKIDLAQWGPAVVAGNLPYYITSPILRRTLALVPKLKRAVYLVQKEVAQRLVSPPGSRRYGLLSVLVQYMGTVETVLGVPPSAFVPPPKVESTLIRFVPRRTDPPEPGLVEFLMRCFHQKRKTLRNNLAGGYDRAILESLPETSLRAEQLSVEQLVELYHRLEPARIAPRKASLY